MSNVEQDLRIISANGDVVLISISEISAAGDHVAEDVEVAIHERFADDDDVVIEDRSRD